MTEADLLAMLKTDTGISTDVYDERLTQYIKSAKAEIEREGISFPSDLNVTDAQLVIMYAGWMWRKRATGEDMPRMLRYALNNRIFSEKMKEEKADG